jgi:predicted MFS family arabinose efflux permease
MTYWGEIRARWRFIAATCLGQAAGYSILTYINNLFTPHLLQAFHWSRADFARVGTAFLLGILIQPITGRLGDAFGARRVATVGVIGGPLVFVGLSLMTGELWQFFALTLIQLILTSGATGPLNYSRLIVKNLDRARGSALAVAASAPPAVAALLIPSLSHFIDARGWRAGYLAVAFIAAVGGLSALLLIPKGADRPQAAGRADRQQAIDYGSILRSPQFHLLVSAVFLCMLSFTLQTTQLKVVLLDRGIDSATGTSAIALFALATIAGRLLCGFALDRYPAHAVAAVFLGLPGVGLSMLAAGVNQPLTVATAVSLLGTSLGAEGDVWAYLVRRYFKPEMYGTVLGLVFSAMALSTGLGALLLSETLKHTAGFTPFLIISAVSVFLGSGLLLSLRPPQQRTGDVTA